MQLNCLLNRMICLTSANCLQPEHPGCRSWPVTGVMTQFNRFLRGNVVMGVGRTQLRCGRHICLLCYHKAPRHHSFTERNKIVAQPDELNTKNTFAQVKARFNHKCVGFKHMNQVLTSKYQTVVHSRRAYLELRSLKVRLPRQKSHSRQPHCNCHGTIPRCYRHMK